MVAAGAPRRAVLAAAALAALAACSRDTERSAPPSSVALTVGRAGTTVTLPSGSTAVAVLYAPAEAAPTIAALRNSLTHAGIGSLDATALVTEARNDLSAEQRAVLESAEWASPDLAAIERLLATTTGVRDALPGLAIGLLCVGPEAEAGWGAVSVAPPGLSSAVMLGVRGRANIDFHLATSVSVLELHAASDTAVVQTHHSVHSALSVLQVPHEMIEYGKVEPAFFRSADGDFDAATMRDATGRLCRWISAPPR